MTTGNTGYGKFSDRYTISPENQQRATQDIAKAIFNDKGFREKVHIAIKSAMDELAGPDQVQNVSVNLEYIINNSVATLQIGITFCELLGKYEVEIKNGRRVSSHTRKYSGARPWQLPDGSWITLDHVPRELAEPAIAEALEKL